MPAAITILVDNQAKDGLAAEHGFSILIRMSGRSVLCDTGQGGTLFANAEALGVDLTRPELLVLSHGHYDHTGGLPELLRINSGLKVCCHPGVSVQRFSLHAGQPVKDISMPDPARQALASLPAARRRMTGQPFELLPGLFATGEIPRRTPFEDTGGPFFLDPRGDAPDPIRDDLSVWIETPAGLVIVLGCCHSGLVNTVEYIRGVSRTGRVRGIVGGMHLLHAREERLEKTCEKLKEWSPEFVIPCHCTGEGAVAFMRSRVGECVRPGFAGMTFSV